MIETHKGTGRSHLIVVVGVDLSEVSEHVVASARLLLRSVDDATLHLVHVMRTPVLRHLLEPVRISELRTAADADAAKHKLQSFCDAIEPPLPARIVLHTPIGLPADELARIARQAGADIIVVEVHSHPQRMFHHSVVARLARTAPCSVLAIRNRATEVSEHVPHTGTPLPAASAR